MKGLVAAVCCLVPAAAYFLVPVLFLVSLSCPNPLSRPHLSPRPHHWLAHPLVSVAAITAPGTTITVQEALAAIRQDSHAAPATYLDDTVVPHGGE